MCDLLFPVTHFVSLGAYSLIFFYGVGESGLEWLGVGESSSEWLRVGESE